MVISRVATNITTEQYKFAGHDTFHLRDGWLYKGSKALQTDGSSLHQIDAHHKLEIRKNMLTSLVYWLHATNLVKFNKIKGTSKPQLELTELAELILRKDTFPELSLSSLASPTVLLQPETILVVTIVSVSSVTTATICWSVAKFGEQATA